MATDSDRPLSERWNAWTEAVSEQDQDAVSVPLMTARRIGGEIAAMEAEVDDWKQRYETLETWYDNRAKGITALEALNDGWQREHYKLEAEVKQLRLLTGWCECDTLPPGGQPCRSCSARLLRVVLNEGGEG